MCIIDFSHDIPVESSDRLDYFAQRYGFDSFFPGTNIPCKVLDFSTVCHRGYRRGDLEKQHIDSLPEKDKKHTIPDSEFKEYSELIYWNSPLSRIAQAHRHGLEIRFPIKGPE